MSEKLKILYESIKGKIKINSSDRSLCNEDCHYCQIEYCDLFDSECESDDSDDSQYRCKLCKSIF